MLIKNVIPLFSRVIVEVETNGSYGDSKIFIPKSAQRTIDSLKGTVVAIGGEVDAVEIGTEVLYGQYSGAKFELNKAKKSDPEYRLIKDEPEYLIMNQEDVLCIIKKEE